MIDGTSMPSLKDLKRPVEKHENENLSGFLEFIKTQKKAEFSFLVGSLIGIYCKEHDSCDKYEIVDLISKEVRSPVYDVAIDIVYKNMKKGDL